MPSKTFDKQELLGKMYVDGHFNQNFFYTPYQGRKDLVSSSGHYGWPKPAPNTDVGGNFGLSYNTIELTSANVGTIQGGTVFGNYHYSGSVAASPFGVLPDPSYKDGFQWGAEAYSKMKPDRPNMSGAAAIYELRDLPGLLRTRFTQNGLHQLGNYWLAQKFGWDPLLQDIRNFILTQMEAQNRLDQLMRDENKPVRRNIKLAASENYSNFVTGVGNAHNPGFVGYFYYDGGQWASHYVEEDRVWASGLFKYYLPPGPRNIEWTNKMKARIFGLYPSPRQVYNVIPWSWLFDWFTGLGNVLDNTTTSVVERLGASYFYVMRQTETRFEVCQTSTYGKVDTLERVPVTVQCTNRSGYKTRLKGDPFGFGISENSLAGSQVAILGALGLSRLR